MNPQITIRSRWVAEMFGFRIINPPNDPPLISMPASMWLKCLWWRVTGRGAFQIEETRTNHRLWDGGS